MGFCLPTLRHPDTPFHYSRFIPPRIRYKLDAVRIIKLSRAMAGVAMHISPRLFLPINLYSAPARMTNVSPSSLRQKTLLS